MVLEWETILELLVLLTWVRLLMLLRADLTIWLSDAPLPRPRPTVAVESSGTPWLAILPPGAAACHRYRHPSLPYLGKVNSSAVWVGREQRPFRQGLFPSKPLTGGNSQATEPIRTQSRDVLAARFATHETSNKPVRRATKFSSRLRFRLHSWAVTGDGPELSLCICGSGFPSCGARSQTPR